MNGASPDSTRGEPWIWLSATKVSTEGVQLAAAVVNPAESPIDYGVSGTFERWSENTWIREGTWVTSLDQWGGFPAIRKPLDQPIVIPSIGLSSPAHGVGPVEYFSLPPLSEGLYRVGHSATSPELFGVIQVVPEAPLPVPIENPHPPNLVAHPTLMQHSQDVRVAALPLSTGLQHFEDVLRFNRELSPSVGLHQWNGESWVLMTLLDVDDSQPQEVFTGEVVVTLPELPTGAYRLVRQNASVTPLARVIWVDSSLPIADAASG
jgi:hypothetical protein